LAEITQRTVEANGIAIHLAEAGHGPLVLFCHGFPASWYSWRQQLKALAQAGCHAVAPDIAGYGQTSQPQDIDQYTLFHLVGDFPVFRRLLRLMPRRLFASLSTPPQTRGRRSSRASLPRSRALELPTRRCEAEVWPALCAGFFCRESLRGCRRS
jgi:alpha/beta hydrolase fold